ncbi:MAG: ribonuclease HII [Treponemataceae bacterium]|nr:ribonuclease HII [Treponemataceae bacterium]
MKKEKFSGDVKSWITATSKAFLCGIDEAGRGPLAGPVLAAAVVLPDDFPVEKLKDSKKLSEKKRLELELLIKEKALFWGLGSASHEEIDSMNILAATMLAMRRAFFSMLEKLPRESENQGPSVAAIVDGIFCPDINCPVIAVPKADAIYPPVMAASILAKTERDRIMTDYGALYPEYGYEKHKGYPTKAHRDICRKKGPSPIQRRTFSY